MGEVQHRAASASSLGSVRGPQPSPAGLARGLFPGAMSRSRGVPNTARSFGACSELGGLTTGGHSASTGQTCHGRLSQGDCPCWQTPGSCGHPVAPPAACEEAAGVSTEAPVSWDPRAGLSSKPPLPAPGHHPHLQASRHSSSSCRPAPDHLHGGLTAHPGPLTSRVSSLLQKNRNLPAGALTSLLPPGALSQRKLLQASCVLSESEPTRVAAHGLARHLAGRRGRAQPSWLPGAACHWSLRMCGCPEGQPPEDRGVRLSGPRALGGRSGTVTVSWRNESGGARREPVRRRRGRVGWMPLGCTLSVKTADLT